MEVLDWKDLLYPYEQAVMELIVKFRCMMKEYEKLGIYSPIESVKGRVKQVSSILDKAVRKGIPMDRLEIDIEDIAGIRILCPFVEDIYKVRTLIRQRNNTDMTILEERDYIENIKPSGYRSYHIIIRYPLNTILGYREVLAEIQIRTLAMNFWATAEHSLRYKYKGNIPQDLMRRLRQCAEAAYRLDEEMATIRGEIMYAKHLNDMKNELVTAIASNMHNAQTAVTLEEMEGLNKEFMNILEEGDLRRLKDFNEQLEESSQKGLRL